MLGLQVEITGYVDDSFPGFVECKLIDAWGNQHLLVEKIPVVSVEKLDASSMFPKSGIIACQIVERKYVDGREILKIESETLWHIESASGETSFDILPNQLIELD